MADNFGLKIGVVGEMKFKKALADIKQSFKVFDSEMNLISPQFDKNDKSVQVLSARNKVLNKEIEAQKQKIETLRSGSPECVRLLRGDRPQDAELADSTEQRGNRSKRYAAGTQQEERRYKRSNFQLRKSRGCA